MTKPYRPKVNLPITSQEKVYNNVALVCVVFLVLGGAYAIGYLPERIPIHWNIKGEVDGYGGKATMLLIPLISVVFYLVFRQIVKIPHRYNYIKKLTQENYESEYINARKLLRLVHMISQLVFVLIVFFMIKGALSEDVDIPNWFVLAVLVIMIGVPLLFIAKSMKNEKTTT